MQQIPFKRGQTFRATGQVRQADGTPMNIATVAIASQVRRGNELVATLEVTRADNAQGMFRLRCNDTSTWPVTTLLMDIKVKTPDGAGQLVESTETVQIVVKDQVTQ